MTTAQALRERGYGITLAEGSGICKAQTRHAQLASTPTLTSIDCTVAASENCRAERR